MCLHGDMPEMRTIGRLTPFYLYLRLPISHQECHYRVGDSVNTQTPSLSPPTFVVSRLRKIIWWLKIFSNQSKHFSCIGLIMSLVPRVSWYYRQHLNYFLIIHHYKVAPMLRPEISMKIIKIFSWRSTFKTQFNVNLDSIQIPSANGPEPVARKLCYIQGKTFDLYVRQ